MCGLTEQLSQNGNSSTLRESAADDNLFKLFSYISFSLKKVFKTHLKPKLVKGSVGCFEIQAFEWTA